jgi:oligopeptidase B
MTPLIVGLCLMTTLQFQQATPPIAKKQPHKTVLHGDVLIDDYRWMREKSNPEVIKHLEAENAYTDAVMKGTEALQEELYGELLGRIKQSDLSVPTPYKGYLYYTRTEEGKQYPIHARKKIGSDVEEVMLDVNKLAEGEKFMSVRNFGVSPDGTLLAYALDNTGYRQYRLQVKDLKTGHLVPLSADRVTSVAWADNRTLFYGTEDEVTKRSDTIWRHRIGGEAEKVFEEKDALYRVYVSRTRDEQFVTLNVGSTDNGEVLVVPTSRPTNKPKLIEKRQGKLKYSIDHRDGVFYIHTNKDAPDYRIMTAPASNPSQRNWKAFVPAIPQGRIEGASLFRNFFVIQKRQNGLPGLEVRDFGGGAVQEIPADEKIYSMGGGANMEFDTDVFRYSYSSPLTPSSVYEIDIKTMQRKLLKQDEVLGGYDASLYTTERTYAQAPDGTLIPIGMTYRKDKRSAEGNPVLLGGYGSYGAPAFFGFNSNTISLLDRGFVLATAQIRGGSDMGEAWYESGKMKLKRNSFTDFIACADHLVYEGVTSRDKLAITGGSAGGLLMGAVLNMRPDLCKAAIIHVPFMDVINTMLDETLPLTVGEFLEWGNPKVEEHYRYMRSYSPYENLRATRYPTILVKTGLNDSQVMYWEPAKYVARMREVSKPELLIFKVNMAAGHGGSSGRFDRLREIAFDYAFLMTALGVKP